VSARALEKQMVVMKFGGSVLTDAAAYRRVAEFLRRRVRAERSVQVVAVVSAEWGCTDRLLRSAREIVARPNPVMLDMLWATGELRSVALLALHLHAVGVRATGLNVHQTGLAIGRGPKVAQDSVEFHPQGIQRALEKFRVVVVPGFLATRRSGSIVSLGRGGSDLSAVLIACGLRAARCELVKDVPGYFTADPARQADARQLPRVSHRQALEMARAGCELVQEQALRVAIAEKLPLTVRSLHDRAPQTEILTPATIGTGELLNLEDHPAHERIHL